MSGKSRIPKTLGEKVAELDDHLFELRKSLGGFRNQDASNLMVIAGELRNLICKSSGTEGLLWRLVDELDVSDHVHVLCSGLYPGHLGLLNVAREQAAPDRVFLSLNHRTRPPLYTYSFRDIVKHREAVRYQLSGFTYESLIGKVANQIGTPHSDEGLEPLLVALKQHAETSYPNYLQLFDFLADVTIEIGERVLVAAEAKHHLPRKNRRGFGDVSLFVAVVPELILGDRSTRFSYGSSAAAIDIDFTFEIDRWSCKVLRAGGECLRTMTYRYQPNQSGLPALGVAFEYSSNLRRGRVLNSFADEQEEFGCDLGWFDVRDVMRYTKLKRKRDPEQHCILSHGIFDRFISTSEARDLAITIPDPSIVVGSHPWRVRNLRSDPTKPLFDQLLEAMLDGDGDIPGFPP